MLYSLLVLARILSDFTFQSENTSKNKRESNFSLLKHGIIVFAISSILTIYYFSLSHFLMILLLFMMLLMEG
jgi:glucose uptake protein GlcU